MQSACHASRVLQPIVHWHFVVSIGFSLLAALRMHLAGIREATSARICLSSRALVWTGTSPKGFVGLW